MKTKNEHKEGCVVCGAAVGWSETCDSICKRAQVMGRTRAGQIKAEIHAADRAERARDLSDRLMNRIGRQATEDLNYNRPYMSVAAA